MMAIDFAKAFDSVNRVVLLRVLMWHRCDPYLILIHGGLHRNIQGRAEDWSDGSKQWCTAGIHWITSTVCDDSEYDYKRNTREHCGIYR